jgi:hypothetical protein
MLPRCCLQSLLRVFLLFVFCPCFCFLVKSFFLVLRAGGLSPIPSVSSLFSLVFFLVQPLSFPPPQERQRQREGQRHREIYVLIGEPI